MKITADMTDDAVLRALGERLARRRLDRGLTQAELAAQSGVSKRTVERIESGASAQLVSVIRVLRTLGLADRLDAVVPEAAPSPMELLRLRGKQRRRAPGRRRASRRGSTGAGGRGIAPGESAEEAGGEGAGRDRDWTWGDET
ncbi:MAG: helix-turn-helix domain-containing protein [Gammaproteobacteria bacterium]|nr:helix-turn-helix domain-containing protein [Gammaproteobacteria bacterium]